MIDLYDLTLAQVSASACVKDTATLTELNTLPLHDTTITSQWSSHWKLQCFGVSRPPDGGITPNIGRGLPLFWALAVEQVTSDNSPATVVWCSLSSGDILTGAAPATDWPNTDLINAGDLLNLGSDLQFFWLWKCYGWCAESFSCPVALITW